MIAADLLVVPITIPGVVATGPRVVMTAAEVVTTAAPLVVAAGVPAVTAPVVVTETVGRVVVISANIFFIPFPNRPLFRTT